MLDHVEFGERNEDRLGWTVRHVEFLDEAQEPEIARDKACYRNGVCQTEHESQKRQIGALFIKNHAQRRGSNS